MDVAGPELEGFFERYVSGREVLPIVETLRSYGRIGLSKPYANELYTQSDENASEEERSAWRWLTQERFR